MSAPRRRPHPALIIALLILSGGILSVACCFGLLGTINRGGGTVFGVGLVAGLLLVLGGLVWAAVAGIVAILRALQRPRGGA